MTLDFEELDYQKTPHGEISLRRRAEPRLGGQILYEVKLGEEFLMSSLFTESEIQLARLGLAGLQGELDVIVGGLGLGYTAMAALENPAVKSLRVIDVMEPVIRWHREGLVPLGKPLTADPRCQLIHDDFFALATAAEGGFDKAAPDKLVHAVLLDIDHSPSRWLNEENSSFYSKAGFTALADKLHPGGVFGLWSDDPPEDAVHRLLEQAFQRSESHVVSFPNPYTRERSSCTVYLAYKAS